MNALPPLPRWFWLLPWLAAAVWWPIEPYWQSDDFFAVHYVQDGGAVLRDFVGPQYGATDVWAFWRPLITASFWLEQRLGGPWPGLSHASNALAHGLSALLVASIWRRFLPTGAAFAAGLVWAVSPAHVGALAWAVGRVDSHSTVWCLLAVWCALRAHERGQRIAWAASAATLGALASKEIALVVPAAATLVVFAAGAGPWRERAHAALCATTGPWLVLAAYVPFRLLVLGTFGGYDAAVFDAPAALAGIGHEFLHFLSPLRWVGTPSWLPLPPGLWQLAGGVPAAVAMACGVRRAPGPAALAAAVAALAFLPMANLLSAADNPQLMRYWYVPTVLLAGLIARAGRWYVAAVLLAWAGPLVLVRGERLAADRESAAIHRVLLGAAAAGAPPPLFVAGLPVSNARGTVTQLQFGVDRLLAPPFAPRVVPLYALRPLALGPDVVTLGDGPAWTLPAGSTWSFAGGTLARAAPAPPLPDLPLAGDVTGVVDLTTPRLVALEPADATGPVLTTPGVRASWFRLTVFTAGGYLATVCRDHAEPGAADGALRLRTWFAGDAARGLEPGRIGYPAPLWIGDALGLPTTVDLSTEFPVLVEAGDLDVAAARPRFVPTHRAARFLVFRFDRGYVAWVRRVQGR